MTMRLVRSALAALLLAAAATMFAPSPAFACSCVSRTPAGFAEAADVVLVGTMERRDEPTFWTSSTDPATYTVTVDRVLKGSAERTQEVLTPSSGASCGLENYGVGDEFVVFASYQSLMGEPTDELWATLCGGTAPADDKLVAEVEAVLGPGSPPSPTTRHRAGDTLAAPAALASGGALVVLTGFLWLRFHRR